MRATSVVSFDPQSQPLTGRCLIEASAGTGKTYAITSLVLRLLLGHDGSTTGVNPLLIEQILIVTFTRIATEELRGRIRERLQKAREAFAVDASPVDDALIAKLLEQSADLAKDRDRLALAAMSLDLASIFTIHAFAGRVLKRNAFESGVSFAVRDGEDDAGVVRETVFDLWRERVYPLPDVAASMILGEWNSPVVFARELRGLLLRKGLVWRGVPAREWHGLLADIARDQAALCVAAQDPAAVEACRAVLRRLNKSSRDAILAFLEGAASGTLVLKDLQKLDRDVLDQGQEKKLRDAGDRFPAVPLLMQAAALGALAAQLPRRFLHDAVSLVSTRLAERKARTAELGFDDLLRLLAEGLDAPHTGDRLAALILRQYPAALVDECQDTDPLQWQIFDRIYRDEGALFLVGDPKQAIYSFRGADVYAYLEARAAATRLCSLGTNWRSTQALVDALNELFSLRTDGDVFRAAGLDYRRVSASGSAEKKPLLHGADPVRPLQIIGSLSAGGSNQEGYRERLVPLVADHIAGMLAEAAANRLTLDGGALAPGDIAILVRNWGDAVPLARALLRRGVPVVSRARDSVYKGAAAASVLALLRAVLEPRSDAALRAALACLLAGRDATELEDAFSCEAEMLSLQETFRDCRERLRARGVQPMFRHLFRTLDVPARALAMADGERLLTDGLHLVELLALERATLDSDEALLARFAECVANADGDHEEQQLRLESDAKRVRILTIHASKGLEFPVVVLPFPFQRRKQDTPLFHDALTWRPVYDLSNDSASIALAEQERLSEDLRLLYVALTRAQHSCVIGVGDVTDRNRSILAQTALGWLLGADTAPPADALQRLLGIPGAQMIGVPSPAIVPPVPASTQHLEPRELKVEPDRHWRSTSYSALASHKTEADRAEQVFRQPELYASTSDAEPDRSPFGFPRGPEYGDMLHKVLERADLAQPAASPGNAEAIRAALVRIGLGDDWHPVVEQMFDDLRACPLDGRELRLCDIARHQRVPEMRFELPVERLDATRVNDLMRAHEPIARQAAELSFKTAHGLLAGSIDLVFCHQGRYFVADYKSNHLGDTLEDYGPQQQEKVIAEHRYDLQYTLYTVALVRYLRARLGAAFDYDTHVGGVYYLFLRGMRSSDANGQGIFFRRPEKALIDGLDQMLGRVAP